MLLENQLRLYQMKKGQLIDTFLRGLNEIRVQLTAILSNTGSGAYGEDNLNVVSED